MNIPLPQVLTVKTKEPEYQAVGAFEDDASDNSGEEEVAVKAHNTSAAAAKTRYSWTRLSELALACFVGFLVGTYVQFHTNNNNNPQHPPSATRMPKTPLAPRHGNETGRTHHQPKQHNNHIDKPVVLSLQEREKFIVDMHDHNLTYLQQEKPTPSGWWPHDLWIHDCVHQARDDYLIPFATDPDYVDYRLCDCVKMCDGCPRQSGHAHAAHNNTLAGLYEDLGCDKTGPHWHVKQGNETLLNQLIDDMLLTREGFDVPDPEAIVIHLRLGDEIEGRSCGWQHTLQYRQVCIPPGNVS